MAGITISVTYLSVTVSYKNTERTEEYLTDQSLRRQDLPEYFVLPGNGGVVPVGPEAAEFRPHLVD